MKNIFHFLLAPAVICWCFFSLMGCKNPAIEDKTLLTQDDNLNLAKDTLHAKVFSELEKPLYATGISTGVLGTITDPNFGSTYAGFYAQFRLTTNNVYFGETPVLDSAVLTFSYRGTYGKFTQSQVIKVYELTESMVDSVNYKTDQTFGVNNIPLATKTGFIPNLTNDTLTAINGYIAPHLRMRADALGGGILNADTNILRDNTAFLNFFKGVYVNSAASTTGDGLTYIDLSSANTGLTLYYHNATDDSLYYTLPVAGVTLNRFANYYNGTPVGNSISNPNVNGEEKMYLQGGAGVKGKILISDLDSLPKNIAINKAEIILTQTEDTTFGAPTLLDLFLIDDAGQARRIDDDGIAGFGGVRVAEVVNGVTLYRYRFNFKKYFQKLIQGVYHNNGFYLETYSANNNSERIIISNSSTNKNYQISIEVVYTKL